MDKKSKLSNLSPRHKTMLIILVNLIIVACVLSAYFKVSIDYANRNYAYEINEIRELQWGFIEDSIDKYYKQAQTQADEMAAAIKIGLKQENLEKNFTKNEEGLSKIRKVTRPIITEGFLNNVKNDNNDPFVATRELLVSDFSENCAADGTQEMRDWETEISKHYNKLLAEHSINAIIRQSREPIFWEFLESSNPEHEMITTMEISKLKNVFLKEGLDGLSTYEFLAVSYIKNKTDILGTFDIDEAGFRTNNDKIIVVQGFNLVDQLRNDQIAISYYNTLLDKEKTFIRENEHDMSGRVITMIVVLGVVVIFAFSLMAHTNNLIKRGEE